MNLSTTLKEGGSGTPTPQTFTNIYSQNRDTRLVVIGRADNNLNPSPRNSNMHPIQFYEAETPSTLRKGAEVVAGISDSNIIEEDKQSPFKRKQVEANETVSSDLKIVSKAFNIREYQDYPTKDSNAKVPVGPDVNITFNHLMPAPHFMFGESPYKDRSNGGYDFARDPSITL